MRDGRRNLSVKEKTITAATRLAKFSFQSLMSTFPLW
jgi:hypothetical protein